MATKDIPKQAIFKTKVLKMSVTTVSLDLETMGNFDRVFIGCDDVMGAPTKMT